jgi:hypothetical protein
MNFKTKSFCTYLFFLGLLLNAFCSMAQIQGVVTNQRGEPLPFVNVYIQDTHIGTTSNENGRYKLDVGEQKEYQLVFQFLGYETRTIPVVVTQNPTEANAVLKESATQLDAVLIDAKEDPAYPIIRNAILHRKENLDKIEAFTADFYSKGIWSVKDMPKKIMGQEVGDFDGALDSTRTGIIYLSETVSKIAFKKPDYFKETIIASKVSGNDNGFSFNSAQDAQFSFYKNTENLNTPIVSPIATDALRYYNYELEGVFYEGNQLINKIKVIPKRPKDRTWSGSIYIVEDLWQIYGLNLTTTGEAIQVPMIKEITFKQNFSFNTSLQRWVKISQTIDFIFDFLGFKGNGSFVAVYSNYNFKPVFKDKTFTNEVLSFLPEANKKDSLYWEQFRPVPLTKAEAFDYVKKDSIQTLRKSKKYLDSIDTKNNAFKITAPILGYSYSNTYKKWSLSYNSPLLKTHFNTVQGWNLTPEISFLKWYDKNYTKWVRAAVKANYGFSDQRVRFRVSIARKFNDTNKLTIVLTGGNKVQQFNASEPISPFINTLSSLFFERNYMKVYDLSYLQLSYRQILFNGVSLAAVLSYQDRSPLFNNTDYVTIPQKDRSYTSNNPLLPNNNTVPAILKHTLFKSSLGTTLRFGQKYMRYPDGIYYLRNSKYPVVTATFENGFGASKKIYNYSKIEAKVSQEIQLGNKGELRYNLHGGSFLNGSDISFIDYQHFNGNQTQIGVSATYDAVFNLLPYYSLSTNNSFFQGHIEHNFKGFVLGKIPGINALNFNLVVGGHFLATKNNAPYKEVSVGLDNLGFGKFRFLRLDYVISEFSNKRHGQFVFGLKFLSILQ